MIKQIHLKISYCCVIVLIIFTFNSCIQEDAFSKATIETNQVTSVTEATAISGGMISADGGSNVTARGVCWSTSPNPTIENDTTIDAAGTGPFTSQIKRLSPSTTYYLRAYAVNRGGVGYGLQMSFTTKTFSIMTTPIALSLVTATTAMSGGNIISDGDSSTLTVKARGVCWNTFPSPTITNCKTTDGFGGGRFASKMDSLVAFTTYYVRAYATNSNGTIYGNEVSFTTQSGIISLTTSTISSITAFTATSGGTISSDGGAPVIERGLCWNTSPSPTTANKKTASGSSVGSFTANITGLTLGTTYYVRTYATNSVGTSYGNEVSFTTLSGVILMTTNAVSSITAYTATSGGNITSDGGATVTARGVCWSTSPSPTTANSKNSIGSGTGTFTANISGLILGTKYYVRAYATNSVGTSYGNEVSFSTLSGVILMTTNAVSSITAYTATSGGNITSDGGAAVTARGVCWNTSPSPTTANNKTAIGNGTGNFTANITGLTLGITYYVRAYATNNVGTSYGNEVSFTTLPNSGTVTDMDGNVYHYITIGTQTWMVENLKATKYNDGTSIPYITNTTEWSNLSTPGYSFYNNDAANESTYGALYNWYTVNTGKLAPTGWHVPTDAEWTTLISYLGGESVAGGKLKEVGTLHWASPNTGATNETGFAGLAGGYRGSYGTFSIIGSYGYWWSSTQYTTNIAWARTLYYNYSNILRNSAEEQYGFSVRCVRD